MTHADDLLGNRSIDPSPDQYLSDRSLLQVALPFRNFWCENGRRNRTTVYGKNYGALWIIGLRCDLNMNGMIKLELGIGPMGMRIGSLLRMG
jgi:hypothetical protein